MNKKYGKIVDNSLVFAPDTLQSEYGEIKNPTEKNYLHLGWKKIINGDNIGPYGYYEKDTEIIIIIANTKYGVLVHEGDTNTIKYAPSVLKVDDNIVEDPTEELYLAAGYYPVIDIIPEPEVGYEWIPDDWKFESNKIIRIYKKVPASIPSYTLSKLKVVIELKKLGILDKVIQWIKDNELYELYLAAQVFTTDNEYFVHGLSIIRTEISELTQEVIDELIQKCIAD